MMDPLVDEYKHSDKGVNLVNLKVAEKKAHNLLTKTFNYTGVIAIIELLIKVVYPAAQALHTLAL
jgi:hypothetical protein